jgi:hydroxyacyl-ACP dehydratase HTD2-like protein with hotdog domain
MSFLRVRHRLYLPSYPIPRSRHSSSFSHLESSLKSRQLPILYDYLTPQSSHLLNTTLVDFLPFLSTTIPTRLPTISSPNYLPIGHHLVYFPNPTKLSSLLPDGTDTLHSPGAPFTHRLWAGGHISFPLPGGPLLDGKRAAIVEGIRSVRISGPPGSEKVFVGIERRVTNVAEREADEQIRARTWADNADDAADAVLIERRDLCFLRPDQKNTTTNPLATRRPLASPTNPDFTHSLTPTTHLLTRYSSLTYNAHAIHLDPLYTRIHYNQPTLLVHGPLLLTLMLTFLAHTLQTISHVIRTIHYRCLNPVFVGDTIRICVKRSSNPSPKPARSTPIATDAPEPEPLQWDVWIEKQDDHADPGALASLAVRATVSSGHHRGNGKL